MLLPKWLISCRGTKCSLEIRRIPRNGITSKNQQNQSSHLPTSQFLISQGISCTRVLLIFSQSHRVKHLRSIFFITVRCSVATALFTMARVRENNILPLSRVLPSPPSWKSTGNGIWQRQRTTVAGFCRVAYEIIRCLVPSYSGSRQSIWTLTP